MKNKIFKTTFILSMSALALTGCDNKEEQKPVEKEEPVIEVEGKYTLIDDGKSNYEILFPEVCVSSEKTAATLLQNYLFKSSSVNLPIVSDTNHDTSKKFISFGLTSQYQQSGIEVDTTKLNGDGYTFNTKDENIYVVGGPGLDSYSYSALELLHTLINFEGYCDQEIYYDTRTKVTFNDLNVVDVPTFANRENYNTDQNGAPDSALNNLLLRNNPTEFSSWGSAHTSFTVLGPSQTVTDYIWANELEEEDVFDINVGEIKETNLIVSSITSDGTNVTINCLGKDSPIVVPEKTEVIRKINDTYGNVHPDWFTGTSNVDQWCYSNEDLLRQVTARVIHAIPTMGPKTTHIFISQMDGHEWCTCDKCNASNEKYGTNAAVVVKFINHIADAMKEYLATTSNPDRNLQVGFFSYTSTEVAPVKRENGVITPIDEEVVLRDNAFVRIAPIYTDYAKEYSDPTNGNYHDAFEGWQVCAKNIIVWNYNTNFSFYMLPFLPYDTLASNYQFFKECNVNGVMEQGSYRSKQAGWQELKNYVTAKLMWNCELNTNDLIEDFMGHYYKDAAPAMSEYFNQYRMKMLLINKEGKIAPSTGGVYGNFANPSSCFSLREVKEWEGLIEEAIASIKTYEDFNPALYTKLYNRIIKEKVFLLYMKIYGYPSDYSETELFNFKKEFKEICDLWEITQIKEGSMLQTVYDSWGL